MNEAEGSCETSGPQNQQRPIWPLKSLAKSALRTADVIATGSSNMVLLEAQTHTAASWLGARCGAELDNVYDQIRIEVWQQDQIIRELKAAGFQVIRQSI